MCGNLVLISRVYEAMTVMTDVSFPYEMRGFLNTHSFAMQIVELVESLSIGFFVYRKMRLD